MSDHEREMWDRAAYAILQARQRGTAKSFDLDAMIRLTASMVRRSPAHVRAAVEFDSGDLGVLSILLDAMARGSQDRQQVKALNLDVLDFGDVYAGDRVRCMITNTFGWVTKVDDDGERAFVLYCDPSLDNDWREISSLSPVPPGLG